MRLAVEEFAARRIWGNCGTRRWNSSRVQERTFRRPRLDASLTSYYPRVGITVGITRRNTPTQRSHASRPSGSERREKRGRRAKRANNDGSVYRYPDGRWVARISAGRDQDGRRIRKTVYALSQAEAQAKLIELQARYQSGGLAITRGRVPTLRTYLSDWLARREGKVGARTLLRYRELIATHLDVDPISRLQVTKLSAGDVDRMLTRRLGTGIAPRTAFHIRAVLRTALNAAIPQLIATNPAAKAEAPDVPDEEMLTLSTKEVGELIKLGQNNRDGPLWSFLVGSGLRLGEALGLRWSDYDEKTGQLQVRRHLRRSDGQYVLTELKTKA